MRITMRQTSFVQTSWCRWDERQRVEPHESHAVITAHVTTVTHTLQVRLHTREGSALLSWKCCILDPFRADCRLRGSLAVSWLHSIQKHKLIIVDLKCGRADFKLGQLGQSGLRLGEEILRLEPGNRLVLEYQAHVLPIPIASNCPAHWWYRAGARKSSEVSSAPLASTLNRPLSMGQGQAVAQNGTTWHDSIQLHPAASNSLRFKHGRQTPIALLARRRRATWNVSRYFWENAKFLKWLRRSPQKSQR